VRIGRSSRLSDVEIFTVFPNAETVEVDSRSVRDVSALRQLSAMRELYINTHSSPKRSLAVFPELRLTALTVAISKPEDIDCVDQCEYLKSLEILGCPSADLSALSNVRAERFRMVGGRVRAATGGNSSGRDSTKFDGCRELEDLGGLTTECLELSLCHRVDLETLGYVERLRNLWICGRNLLSSWRFVRLCPCLERLTVTGTRVDTDNWSPLIESPTLRSMWLGVPVRNRIIEMIGKAKPQCIVTNGPVTMYRGERVPLSEYCRLEEESWKEMRGR
jgi:hypothetical protein